MAFNSVSIDNQVILCLNYLCQELNVRLHEHCVLFNEHSVSGVGGGKNLD